MEQWDWKTVRYIPGEVKDRIHMFRSETWALAAQEHHVDVGDPWQLLHAIHLERYRRTVLDLAMIFRFCDQTPMHPSRELHDLEIQGGMMNTDWMIWLLALRPWSSAFSSSDETV